MRKMRFPVAQCLSCVMLVLSYLSCNTSRDTDGAAKQLTASYSLYTLNKDGSNSLLVTDDITKGHLSVAADGVAVPTERFDRSIIVKNGYYYHIDGSTDRFVKYILTTKGLKPLASLAMVDKHIENIYWNDDRTLILFTLDNKTFSHLEYHIIDVDDFKVLDRGTVNLPKSVGDYTSLSIGFSTFRGDRTLVGYCYGKFLSNTDYTTIDTLYTAVLSYPTMEIKAIHKDPRSAYPGGINTVQQYGFTDEAGDYYFMSCPGIALGNVPSKPTAIFKIPAESDSISTDYWINVTEQIGNDAYGLWYLGDGKAIIRNERKDRYTDFSDHHSTYQFEYHVVDLAKRTLSKLDLPFDKGTRKESVLVENGKAYIAIDDSTDTHRIWCYDSRSETMSPGLSIGGGADFTVRLERQ